MGNTQELEGDLNSLQDILEHPESPDAEVSKISRIDEETGEADILRGDELDDYTPKDGDFVYFKSPNLKNG
jgi:hypothetical protein